MAVRIEAQSEPIPGYKLLERLGAGGFGEVWKAEAPGGIFKAIKIIHGDLRSKDNDVVRYAEQELKSLKRVKQVRHPYLLALDRYDIIDGRLMITMELADCNLWDRFREYRAMGLPGIPRDELLLYMTETAEVLDLFNDQFQLQHLDIKPQNLFLLYNHVKVADFGQVKDLQGLLATVTGGITPVYAAPETFEGVITRYCDQYSLACVYQELLTGQRPFDGSSMSQLLMQHLSLPPNLNPSPATDRPILAKALAKKPEERWPSVSAFVRALMGADAGGARPAPAKPSFEAPTAFSQERKPLPNAAFEATRGPTVPLPRLVVPGSAAPSPQAVQSETPTRGSTEADAGPAFLPVPPEQLGEGPLRPALIIGLGQVGLRVLQRLRFDLTEFYGASDTIPIIKMLYVDVDPDAVAEAVRPRPRERLAGLSDAEILPTPLQRPAHYSRPRLNGRTITEGWFDPQILYKLPSRGSTTMGIRPLGRLAFCDHYRSIMARSQTLLEQAVTADSLAKTEARTGLASRTNRPRVYIVAGLAGGTGGGMFLDAAYAVRHRLQRMGYTDPEIVGLLFVPPSDAAVTPPQALGNTYASLTELNHFARPDTTFVAGYDERNGVVREKSPPFSQCFLFQGTALGLKLPSVSSSRSRSAETVGHSADTLPPQARSGPIPQPAPRSGVGHQRPLDARALMEALKPYGTAADLIRLNHFTLVGKAADELRGIPAEGELPAQGVTLSAFGTAAFGWPRAEVVTQTAAKVGRLVLQRWAAPDLQRIHEVIPTIAQDKWSQLKLNPEVVQGKLQLAADLAGERVEEQIIETADPLIPRGWLARLPDPGLVAVALEKLLKLLGPPASTSKRTPTPVEQALNQVVQETGAAFAAAIAGFVPSLVNDPRFRLAGTEEMIRQFLVVTDRLLDEYLRTVADLEYKAQTGFERMSQYAYFSKENKKKPTTTEFGDAVKQFPRARFQAMMMRSMIAVYQILRKALDDRLTEVADARKKLEAASEAAQAATVVASDHHPGAGPRLMPPGCSTISEAVERFLAVLTDADMGEIDRRVQRSVDRGLGGVIQACRATTSGPEHVVAAVFEETRAHLDLRLGRVDLAAMFAERYRTVELAEQAIGQTYLEAEPAWLGEGPWSASEITVFGCPCDPGGQALQELAQRAIPVAGLPLADTPDDLIVYREWPTVPLAALTQLGPAAAAAYQHMVETQQGMVHARLDVTRWVGVDDRE